MTNADVIRKMTDKQLFDFLSEWECGDIDYSITFCDLCMQSKREGGKGNELGLDCDGCRKHWLKRDAVDYGGLMYWKRNTTYTGKDTEMFSKENAPSVTTEQSSMVGEWKPFDRTWGREIWACSVCEESVANMPTNADKPLYDYCPNCGAIMKG